MPTPLNSSMAFGSAVHYALEILFRKMNEHPDKKFGSVIDFMSYFKWYMKRLEESITEIEFKRRMEYGEKILPNYYETYINQWNKITSIERTYRNVIMEGVPLNGKLDKIEFIGNMVNVIDYKTGQFEKAKGKLLAPNTITGPTGNNIFRVSGLGGVLSLSAVSIAASTQLPSTTRRPNILS